MRCKSTVLLSAMALVSSAAPAFAATVAVGVVPPVAMAQPVPAPSVAGYVWRPGYWSWDGARYVWIPGIYLAPPMPRATWVPGHWIASRGRWAWVGGHWR